MVKFSKELEGFLNSIDIPGIRTKEDLAEYTQSIPRSTSYITPGNIIAFKYDSVATIAFVVSTPKSGLMGGQYVSSRNNTLVTAFKLNGVSDIVTQSIVANLYMKPRKSKYINKKHKFGNVGRANKVIDKSGGKRARKKSSSVTRSLKTVLGKDKFRTYNLGKMIQIRKIEVPTEGTEDIT